MTLVAMVIIHDAPLCCGSYGNDWSGGSSGDKLATAAIAAKGLRQQPMKK